MKKRWILLILPLMMMVMPVASANGWGLPEALVPLVSNTNDYDDYYHLADDYARKENSARIIMQSRYHNQLIAAEKGADGWVGVIYSTTAVYQPSEQSTSGKPKLARINNGFELAYPKVKELYRFERISNDRGETAYTLTYAKMGGVEVERQESYRYLVTQGEDSAMWVTEVTLENFNIHNMPRRGVGDVRRMRNVHSSIALYYSYDNVGWIGAQNVPGKKSGKQSYPVYAAPSTEASRAAKGKASFSTGDDYRIYCTEGDWSLIEYRVSQRTSRFGWAQIGQPPQSLRLHIPMLTAYDTYLTDDPHVSEYHQAELPAGTKLTMWYLLGVRDDWAYAYVEATVDGKPMCGFVPRRDVVIDEVELPDEAAKYGRGRALLLLRHRRRAALRRHMVRGAESDGWGGQLLDFGGKHPCAELQRQHDDALRRGLYRVHDRGGRRRVDPAAGESRLRGGRMHLRPLWRGGQIRQLGGNGGRKRAPNDAADSIMQRSCER